MQLMQPPNNWRLLQKGKLGHFKPFNAITMRGKGPSAQEMVLQYLIRA